MRANASAEPGDEAFGPPRISTSQCGTEAGEPDQEILAALRAGDRRAAMACCARRHGPALGRVCMAMLGSQGEADDIVQETLLAAHDGFDGFRGDSSVLGWLLGIARRKCVRQLERRTRQEARLRLVHDIDRATPTDELLARCRRAERARVALETVRPSEREALLLRYVGELSYRDVGAACGIDEAAARKRVSRALAQLRNVLGNEE